MLRSFLQRRLSNQRLVRPAEFVIKMAAVYILWRMLKYGGEHSDQFLWGGWEWFNNVVGNSLTACSAVVLRAMGYELTYYKRMLTVDGTSGIFIGDLCLGIAPMVIFTGFILSYGNQTKNKLWFIPLGLFGIYLTNLLRTLALILLQVNYNRWFKVAHEYIYVLITYGLIFLLVIWWMNKLADKPSTS